MGLVMHAMNATPAPAATDLRTIVYVSSATHKLSEAEMEALLLDARAANQRHGVTGILLYGEGNFMQCVEGPPDAVELVYARIRASRLHHDLIKLMDEPSAERYFPDWYMGVTPASHSEQVKLSSAQWQRLSQDAARAAAPPGMLLLQRFWQKLAR